MNNRFVCALGWGIWLAAMAVLPGRASAQNPEQSPAAKSTGINHATRVISAKDEQGAFRIINDAKRSRVWVLSGEDVRVYDQPTNRLIRQMVLPGWYVLRFRHVCKPDLALDASGSAYIAGNVVAKLWRIDGDSFDISEHDIALQEGWDNGFGALAFSSNGTLYALTSTANSLWRIDLATASGGFIDQYKPPLKACVLDTRSLDRIASSQQPRARSSTQWK